MSDQSSTPEGDEQIVALANHIIESGHYLQREEAYRLALWVRAMQSETGRIQELERELAEAKLGPRVTLQEIAAALGAQSAELPRSEPVAWRYRIKGSADQVWKFTDEELKSPQWDMEPLYLAPHSASAARKALLWDRWEPWLRENFKDFDKRLKESGE